MSPTTFVLVTPEELEALIKRAVGEALDEHREAVRPLLLDRRGIAQALGIGTTSVDRFRKAGMPFVRLGDSPRYIVDECIAWLRGQREPLAAESPAEQAPKDFP